MANERNGALMPCKKHRKTEAHGICNYGVHAGLVIDEVELARQVGRVTCGDATGLPPPSRRGPLTVTGAQFFNWHLHEGGGRAIDLVMHRGSMEANAAVAWLEQHLSCSPAVASSASQVGPPAPSSSSS